MTASKISGFDDYCKALSGADDSEIAYLMLLLRGWMIKVQFLEHRIEEEKSENLLSNNEEFINLFVSKVNNYTKKFRLPVFENFINSTQC